VIIRGIGGKLSLLANMDHLAAQFFYSVFDPAVLFINQSIL
jgi:hypothetical protein